MQYIFSTIEQLDLAARQLEHVRPSFARFALLLVDNVVELMLHGACSTEIVRDMPSFAGKPKYDAAERKKVLGRHFNEKTAFCRKHGIISQDECDFINTCHLYRNELYHVGIRHDAMIYPFAWQYHELACDLFVKLKPRCFQWLSKEAEISDAVQLHWPGETTVFDIDRKFAPASDSLKRLKPSLSPPFAKQVSDQAERAVASIDEWLDFLVSDNFDGDDEATVIANVQFADHLENTMSVRMIGFHSLADLNEAEQWKQFMDKVRSEWRPIYKERPTPRWRNRAQDLRTETNPSDVTRKYNGLMEEMSCFDRAVSNAARDLDTAIQLQVDQARGK